MWQYQNTDELYHSSYNNSDELYHGKYIRKYMGKNGKMVYVYNNSTVTTSKYKNGNITQNTINIDKKNGSNINATTGNSVYGKYASVGFGKSKNDKEVSKSVKIGRVTLNYNNEAGQHNLRVDVANKKKKVNKGKSAIKKILNVH